MKIAPSRLLPDAGAETEALIKEARKRQHRRYLLTGLAIVTLAGAAGVAVSQIGSGGQPSAHAIFGVPLASMPPRYSSAPAYYAYTVPGDIYNYVSDGTQYGEGVNGRYLKVRATATGKLLATIRPPKPYNDFSLLAADADGRTFVFGAMRFWERNASASPKLTERDPRTPMKFLVLSIPPGGSPELSALRLPETLTPGQTPSIALSPDGTRLAVAFGGGAQAATLQVITLATGHIRQWAWPHTPWRPVLNADDAWTADGQTLAFVQQAVLRGQSLTAIRRYRQLATTQVRLIDTARPGTSLTSGTLLILHPPAGASPPGQLVITPDGTKLIGPVETRPLAQMRSGRWTGELAVYSARTGALLRTLAPWVWHWPSPPGRGGNPDPTVAWSNRSGSQLIILQPRDDLNVLGVLSGNAFTQTGSKLLPQPPSAYQELQYALRIAAQMTW